MIRSIEENKVGTPHRSSRARAPYLASCRREAADQKGAKRYKKIFLTMSPKTSAVFSHSHLFVRKHRFPHTYYKKKN